MKFQIDLNTGNRFWTPKGLGALGMEPSRAIAELVANSLDWRREDKADFKPAIQILLSSGSIEVRDNGVGMTASELQNAIQVSVANDDLRPTLRVRKGMFGMGMKVACLSLGWNITITTRSYSEKKIEHKLILNTRELDADGVTNDYRNSIKGESSALIFDGPLNSWQSGTSILIEDLTHRTLSAIAIRDSLQEVFSPEIAIENVAIEIIDLEADQTYKCEKITVPVYPGSVINLDDLDLTVNDDITGEPKKIRGWLGLMKTSSSGGGNWGLHLFKNNQVIERFHQLPRRLGGLMPKNPHPEFARTYGEVHLDMCVPSFHKIGFDYSKESWNNAAELLGEHILAIMTASKEFKAKDYEKSKDAIKKVQKYKRAVTKALTKPRSKSKDAQIEAPDNAIILPDGEWFTVVEPIINSLGNNERNKPWIYHYRTESRELAIVINDSSPTYTNLIGDEVNDNALSVLVCWAISDCILALLCNNFMYDFQDAIAFRDEQLIWLTSERGGEDV